MYYEWGRQRRSMLVVYWWESQKVKRPLGRPRCRSVKISKWILDRMGWYGVDSSDSG
jgi:hypothetical protein